jgi:hypothetical protein
LAVLSLSSRAFSRSAVAAACARRAMPTWTRPDGSARPSGAVRSEGLLRQRTCDVRPATFCVAYELSACSSSGASTASSCPAFTVSPSLTITRSRRPPICGPTTISCVVTTPVNEQGRAVHILVPGDADGGEHQKDDETGGCASRETHV